LPIFHLVLFPFVFPDFFFLDDSRRIFINFPP
jgi:hypothetical protein